MEVCSPSDDIHNACKLPTADSQESLVQRRRLAHSVAVLADASSAAAADAVDGARRRSIAASSSRKDE